MEVLAGSSARGISFLKEGVQLRPGLGLLIDFVAFARARLEMTAKIGLFLVVDRLCLRLATLPGRVDIIVTTPHATMLCHSALLASMRAIHRGVLLLRVVAGPAGEGPGHHMLRV